LEHWRGESTRSTSKKRGGGVRLLASCAMLATHNKLPDEFYPSGFAPSTEATTLLVGGKENQAQHSPPPGPLRECSVQRPDEGSTAALAVRLDQHDADAEDDCCYICLSSDGPMLVNVCACRSMRAHRSCLEELASRSAGPPTCGVCRQEICMQEAWVAEPEEPEARPVRYRPPFLRVCGMTNVLIGTALLFVGGVGLMLPTARVGPPALNAFLALSGFAVFSYSCHLAVNDEHSPEARAATRRRLALRLAPSARPMASSDVAAGVDIDAGPRGSGARTWSPSRAWCG